jgi:cysteinyl-tRNA synthetase
VLHLYDTATRDVRELALREPGKVSIYLCGPTVYGPPHLGHGRATLVYDILRRYLEWTGLEVRLVSNITDIEDKIIDRAQREPAVAGHHDQVRAHLVRGDGGHQRPPSDRRAPRHRVRRRDGRDDRSAPRAGQRLPDRRRHLPAVETVDYGLSPTSRSTTCAPVAASARCIGAEQKRHPADFVLWKFSKPDEPSWPSPWGDGPTRLAQRVRRDEPRLLGEGFDLHCGGQDLRFPHHENERAQAVALGKRFANHWMHNGFVVDAEGEKMSKSLGNVSNLLDLIELYDPRAYRMVLLQSHYRSPVKITQDNIDAAVKALAGLDAFAARTASVAVADAPPDDVLERSAGDGRRPRHTEGDGAAVRHGSTRTSSSCRSGSTTSPRT